MNFTDIFLDGIQQLVDNEVPDRILMHTKDCFIDYLGCVMAGSKVVNKKEDILRKSFYSDAGQAFVFGSKQSSSVLVAALMNGISAHSIELDDGHRYAMMHPGSPVFSALVAINEDVKLSSYDFLKAAVVGYEVAIRLACAVQPSNKLRGYHATGTCGTVGVAMAIATALHFDREQMKSAFSAATTSAAGLLEMIEGDSEMKPYNIGRAAMDGIMAAMVGRARFKAPKDALGGKRGFLNVMTDKPNMKYITDFDASHYAIEGIYRKSYAACRHLHPAIESALCISKLDGFDSRNVESILVDTYHLAVFGHDHQTINGVNSAKMSIPYSVAVSLVKGSANMDDFSDKAITDSEVLTLAKKVIVSDNDQLTSLCPAKRVSIVHVTMNNGTVYSHRIEFPKGEPENPLVDKELQQKFYSLAMSSGLSRERCSTILELVYHSDFNVNELLALCVD